MAQARTKGDGHEPRNLSILIRSQYLHPVFSTKWLTAHNSANPAHKERVIIWHKLNEMWQVNSLFLPIPNCAM